jgi:putative ABC transport system permease protein
MPGPTDRLPDQAIARQIVLPWRKSMAMALNSLQIRFFRSLITTLSLVLAIAFFCFTLTNAAIARELFRLHGESVLPMLIQAGYSFDPISQEVTAGPRELWLLVLSLLVCTVGIVNAQLMSVTERFREIGIMKCLGALDTIILRLFLLEAVVLGVIGAGAGAFLGLAAAWASSLFRFDIVQYTDMHLLPLLAEVIKAWAMGIGLSILGVLYPAILAARLQPVIVMREEH